MRTKESRKISGTGTRVGTGHRQSNNPIRSVPGFVDAKRRKLNSLENVMHSLLGKQTYELEWSLILTTCLNGGDQIVDIISVQTYKWQEQSKCRAVKVQPRFRRREGEDPANEVGESQWQARCNTKTRLLEKLWMQRNISEICRCEFVQYAIYAKRFLKSSSHQFQHKCWQSKGNNSDLFWKEKCTIFFWMCT